MTYNQSFSFHELFASSAPDPQPVSALKRARYDFAVAYPDPDSIPLDGLLDGLREPLQQEGRGLAVYPHPQGYPPLREFVAARLAVDRGINVEPDEIILADGSSQPIHMLIEALIDPGDVVFTECFVYLGTLRTLGRFRADVRGVPCDDKGMIPSALERSIRAVLGEGKKPKMVYTIPTFQNPLGFTMPVERRKALLRLSAEYNIPILEDDCYVDLRYDGVPVASIHSLDGAGRVMYVGSFSKVIAPGIRLGYMTAPPEVMDRVRAIKSGGGVNQLAALAVHRYAISRLRGHIDEIRAVLRVKRDTMLAALGESFGPSATWSHPDGGLYLWLQVPEDADLAMACEAAFKADVGYVPGPAFSPDGVSGRNCARLCFGYNTPQEIREGIARLSEVLAGLGIIEV